MKFSEIMLLSTSILPVLATLTATVIFHWTHNMSATKSQGSHTSAPVMLGVL